jgi:glycosyltransferase involved in cell wall biosynthesis
MMQNDETTNSTIPPKLSVVIIGRNEEQFIAGAIESVLAAAPLLAGLEVIFADSASTDRSVDIAKQYPIKVLQLRKDWPLCVAAGRYTGYLHSRGDYVFFQDGDSRAEAEWLVTAVRFMEEHPEYAAVAGVLDEEYVDSLGVHCGGAPNVFQQNLNQSVNDCKNLGGIALFRRRAMEVAGPVNPHLPTAEDHELCLRLRNAGFKVARISGLMATKFTENRQTIREVLRRSRTKMYDYGAVVRHAGVYGGAVQFCLDGIPFVVSFALTILLFLIATPVVAYYGQLWMLPVAIGLLGVAQIMKKGGLHGAGLSLAVRSVSTYRTVLSYLKTRAKPIEDYPTDVIRIR